MLPLPVLTLGSHFRKGSPPWCRLSRTIRIDRTRAVLPILRDLVAHAQVDGFDTLALKGDSQYRLPPSRCVALANRSGRNHSKVEISIVGIQSRNVVGVVVQVIAATDSHTVENVVEFHSQLGPHPLTQENFLVTAKVSLLSKGFRKPE